MKFTVAANVAPFPAAMLSLVLLAPAAVFLAANILNELGIGFLYVPLIGLLYAPVDALVPEAYRFQVFNLVSPVVFLGGIASTLVLNSLAITRLELRWEQNRLITTVAIEPRIPNLALIFTGGLMLAAFVGYAFVENYEIIVSHL